MEAYKCIVTSEAIANDKQHMKTTAECLSKNEDVLERKESTEENPHPEAEPLYSRFATVDRDGSIRIEDSNGQNFVNTDKKMTQKELDELNENLRQMHENMAKQQQQFQSNMANFQKNMQEQMQNTFGKGFPFDNSAAFPPGFPFHNQPHPAAAFPPGFPFHNQAHPSGVFPSGFPFNNAQDQNNNRNYVTNNPNTRNYDDHYDANYV